MKLLSKIMPTNSPKCLLNLPPKGWNPESRMLPRPGLFASECLYFRSGICYTIWFTWALAMMCPCYLALLSVSVKAMFRPQFSVRRQTANQMRRPNSQQSRQRNLFRGDLAVRQNNSDYIVNVGLRKFVYDHWIVPSARLHLLAATAEFRHLPPLPTQSIIPRYVTAVLLCSTAIQTKSVLRDDTVGFGGYFVLPSRCKLMQISSKITLRQPLSKRFLHPLVLQV